MEGFGNLQFLRNTLLAYLRVRISLGQLFVGRGHKVIEPQICRICTSALSSCDQIMDRVLGLVKKFDKIDGKKVVNSSCHDLLFSLSSVDFRLVMNDLCSGLIHSSWDNTPGGVDVLCLEYQEMCSSQFSFYPAIRQQGYFDEIDVTSLDPSTGYRNSQFPEGLMPG